MVRLASEGNAPESALFWSERVASWVSILRSEGRVPESDLDARLMAVTRLEVSQLMPVHLQYEVVVDQSEGVPVSDLRSFDMTAASSAAVVERRESEKKRKKKKERLERGGRVLGPNLGRAIQIWENVRERERERESVRLGFV